MTKVTRVGKNYEVKCVVGLIKHTWLFRLDNHNGWPFTLTFIAYHKHERGSLNRRWTNTQTWNRTCPDLNNMDKPTVATSIVYTVLDRICSDAKVVK